MFIDSLSIISKYHLSSSTVIYDTIHIVPYQVYTGGRWLPNVTNLTDYAGIYGQAIQGVYASLSRGSIQYRTHTQGGAWLPWVTDRTDYTGSLGKNVDGLQMQLVGLSGYNVRYRAYVGGRWLPWVTGTSDYAGIFGQSIECIQVEIISSGGGFDKAGCLKRGGNIGLFKDLGIGFKEFDVWTGLAIVNLNPIVLVDGKLSLSPDMPGNNKTTVDISGGTDGLASIVYKKMKSINLSLDVNLNETALRDTFKGFTFDVSMSKYISVGIQIEGGKLYIYVQGSFTYNGTNVYQTVRLTMYNYYSYSTVAVPVAVSSGKSPATSTRMDSVEIVSNIGMAVGIGLMLTSGAITAAPILAGFMMFPKLATN